jgi:hypothetical protein
MLELTKPAWFSYLNLNQSAMFVNVFWGVFFFFWKMYSNVMVKCVFIFTSFYVC